jgi:hypothetical protein
MSWILIVTESNEVSECLFNLENKYDELMDHIDDIRQKEIAENDKSAVTKNLDQIKEIHRSLIKLLQKEIREHLKRLNKPTQKVCEAD